jgi:hypothetical protein
MTEPEWFACKMPEPMLSVVAHATRKLRLFALACCARIDHLITDPRSRAALEFAARHVETPVNRQKGRTRIEKAGRAAWRERYDEMFNFTDERNSACLVRSCAANAAVQTLNVRPPFAASYSSSFACFAVAWGAMYDAKKSSLGTTLPDELKAPEYELQVHLLRDVFGNPFRPVAPDPAWLTPDVVALARGIYAEQAFDRMPILADALQDAGCANDEVLKHCRDTSLKHVRGCWPVDLLSGKG